MVPFCLTDFGNPAAVNHQWGYRARDAVEEARKAILQAIDAPAGTRLVFTSGATESCNLAILGSSAIVGGGAASVITQATEHRCVLAAIEAVGDRGIQRCILPVENSGRLDPRSVRDSLASSTVLVSVMAVNNEIGTIQPICEIAGAVREHSSALLHVDASQTIGKVPFSMSATGADLVSFSAHKIYGPKGMGALAVGPRAEGRIRPLLYGGPQEFGLRPGTLNVPGIIGFARAIELAVGCLEESRRVVEKLRQRFLVRLQRSGLRFTVHGHATERVPGIVSVALSGVSIADLMAALPDVAMSSGSACESSENQPSHVLLAIGLTVEAARSTARISFGHTTPSRQLERAADLIVAAASALQRGNA